MYVKEKICNHFLNLIYDQYFAFCYFMDKDIGKFNNDELRKIKIELRKAKFRFNKLLAMFVVVETLGIEDAFFDLALNTEKARKVKCRCENDLEIFESNLVYLIVSNIINIDYCVSVGFDEKYINELLDHYKKYLDNTSVEYYFDWNTGKTLQIMNNGKAIVLPYTPIVVRNKICEENNGKVRIR